MGERGGVAAMENFPQKPFFLDSSFRQMETLFGATAGWPKFPLFPSSLHLCGGHSTRKHFFAAAQRQRRRNWEETSWQFEKQKQKLAGEEGWGVAQILIVIV